MILRPLGPRSIASPPNTNVTPSASTSASSTSETCGLPSANETSLSQRPSTSVRYAITAGWRISQIAIDDRQLAAGLDVDVGDVGVPRPMHLEPHRSVEVAAAELVAEQRPFVELAVRPQQVRPTLHDP